MLTAIEEETTPFWSVPPTDLMADLRTSSAGLTTADADRRRRESGEAKRGNHGDTTNLRLLLSQFKSPILLLLIFAAILSWFLKDAADSLIILMIVFVSGFLGFWQERGAADAVRKLMALVQTRATCLRDGKPTEIPVGEVVPGDLVLLTAGSMIPADCRILDARNLFVNEASLSGETFPAEKTVGPLPAQTPLAQRTNTLFKGTFVVSGSATALAVHTAVDTEFGKISQRLASKPPETEFERGIRQFGYLLMEVTLLLVVGILVVNVYLKRPVLDSFLFALALAVGLTPQLLPTIISITLARGAKRMAAEKVIVKRLAAIENFGSMDVLCTDKTGTLTEGVVQVHSAVDYAGQPSSGVLFQAALNSRNQTGYTNPIDQAIAAFCTEDTSQYRKLDEEPYDFIRKRLSVLLACPASPDSPGAAAAHLMVTKGAFDTVLQVCTTVETATGVTAPLGPLREEIRQQYQAFSGQGFRTLGIASRDLGAAVKIDKDDENGMTFLGFLLLSDPLQAGIIASLEELRSLGISLKLITGDNALVAATIGKQAGLSDPVVLTGTDLRVMSTDALRQRASGIDIFAEVEPNQKERIILALMKAGHVVGYMGDGINDASALHAADVGISVASAADVAKEAADIVLLEKDLSVLARGVREGRITFANTIKYVFMATSANFGNMFSMAGASLFLPFLPLLPKQVLLTNLLTDLPEMTIATDSVDSEMIERPRRWDIAFIRRFMVVFGLISSVFDYLTFGVLRLVLHAGTREFRTGWFMESVVSASVIALVVRTRKPFYRSRPSMALMLTTASVAVTVLLIPYSPLAPVLGLTPVPIIFLPALLGITVLYAATVEIAKRFFYRNVK